MGKGYFARHYVYRIFRFFTLMEIYSAVMTFVKIFILQLETVSATDPDEGGNGQFRYSIESGDPDDQFSIDGMNACFSDQSMSIDTTLNNFLNAALFPRLGLPSTLIRHENGAYRKGSSYRRNLTTPTLRFSEDGKHFENEAV